MAWLINSFGFDILINKPSLVADQAYIPVTYTANLESAQKMAAVVAAQMDVDPALIQLHLYQEGQRQIGNDGLSRFSIIMQAAENQTYSGGKYFGADENGNYQLNTSILVTAKNYNQPVSIKAPDGAKKLQDLLNSMSALPSGQSSASGTQTPQSRDAQRISDMRQLITAQEMWYGDKDKSPCPIVPARRRWHRPRNAPVRPNTWWRNG